MHPLRYPQVRKVDQEDDYHGVRVADPYRWLEDDRSAETAAWVEAENKVTFDYLERIPYRQKLKERLESLYNYPRYTAPFRRGENFFFSKNDGLQNQNVLYIQKGLEGTPEVLLDPNELSSDGTSRLVQAEVSRDGRYLAYAISRGGSDWEEARILEIATRLGLNDHLQWIKVSGLAWAGDGFFYSRYDAPDAGEELSAKNENHKVFYHRLNTPQSEDEPIYENEAFPQRFHTVSTTEDERFAILTISDRGAGKDGNALFFRDLSSTTKTFAPIIAEISDDQYGVIDHVGGKFLIATNHQAPNHKVLLFDPANPSAAWAEILPEREEPLEEVHAAGGRLFAMYTQDVVTHAFAYRLDGTLENEIALPGAGSACGFSGRHDDRFVFYSYTSFNFPPAIFLYDMATKTSTVFREPKIPGFDAEAYESKEIFYSSKDGTRVPMFLVYKKGLKLDGNNPTLLNAYGGFNISLPPNFSSLRLALLEQGFVYASANIRGGGEYGETWHQGGMKLRKQNVFDDFIAAAEWLMANKYTSPAKLGINGASNGGLLVGAVMNQRPELFGAAVPQVGVMDMLRFQKFTIGWNWIADYGSSDDPREFKALYAYSPLQNIRADVKYPATLITTADHDDRVVPAHSFKYAVTLQEKASAENPVLIRIDTKSGHGASNTSKQIELLADIYSFLFYSLGVTPRF